MIDYLIRNATIIDGLGGPAYGGDLAIEGRFIARVGRLGATPAKMTIDAQGRTVTPGFIDMHSHSDLLFANGRPIVHKLLQGVTTELIGQDGISVAPLTESSRDFMAAIIEPLAGQVDGGWEAWDMAGFLGAVAAKKQQLNLMTLTGHANLRMAVMGHRMAEASAEDLGRMRELLAESMDQGSFGLSLGLIYPPSSYSNTAELIGLGEIVRQYDGLIVSHMRNEQDRIFEALDEMIAIGQESGARIHISHLKCLGKRNWGQMSLVLERLERARDNGVDISFDQYPYDASCTTLSLLAPGWALEGGWEGFQKKLDNFNYRLSLLEAIRESMAGRGGPDSIKIASVPVEGYGWLMGNSLVTAADMWGLSPEEAVCKILSDSKLGAIAIYHAMSPADVECAMIHPLHTVGSDGVLGEFPHPRAFGAFPRIIRHYHKERNLFTLETAIKDMTAKPAQVMKLARRGRIEPGCFADVLVFDPVLFTDRATYDHPSELPSGMEWVFVNGEPAVEGGSISDRFAGQVLGPEK